MFCKKCGKEILDEAVICVGCGCPVEKNAPKAQAKPAAPSYDSAVSGAGKTNLIAGILLGVGVLVFLFVSMWIGIFMCLAAELVALIPNTKLQKAYKANNVSVTDKKALKEGEKTLRRVLKVQYPAYKSSFIIAYVALACLIITVVWSQFV